MGIVTLVEGESDRAAVEALARRHDCAIGPVLVAGGAMGFGARLAELVPAGHRVAGLVDANEAPVVAQALERVGLAGSSDPAALATHGFFTCHRDLEDELIRSLGGGRVIEVLSDQRELEPFRTFQNQPAWRGRPLSDQLHRFLGIRSGRKVRYGTLLVDALDDHAVPAPLLGLLGFLSK